MLRREKGDTSPERAKENSAARHTWAAGQPRRLSLHGFSWPTQAVVLFGVMGRFMEVSGTSNFPTRWWAHQDLNLEPTDYESAALTVELWARWAGSSISRAGGREQRLGKRRAQRAEASDPRVRRTKTASTELPPLAPCLGLVGRRFLRAQTGIGAHQQFVEFFLRRRFRTDSVPMMEPMNPNGILRMPGFSSGNQAFAWIR